MWFTGLCRLRAGQVAVAVRCTTFCLPGRFVLEHQSGSVSRRTMGRLSCSSVTRFDRLVSSVDVLQFVLTHGMPSIGKLWI